MKERSDPGVVRLKAVVVMTFLEGLLLVGAGTWSEVLGGPAVLEAASKPLIVAGMLGMFVLNYSVAVLRDERWREFERRFIALPAASRRRGMLLAGAAIVFPFVFVGLAFAVLAYKSHGHT